MIRYILIALVLVHLVVATSCMMANPKEQRAINEPRLAAEGMLALNPGDPAPPLEAVAHNGSQLSVPAGLDGKQLALFFYPIDDTPNTTRELLSLGKWAAELTVANIMVFGISKGTVDGHSAYAKKYGIMLPLLADPAGAISAAYGCAPEGGDYLQRTVVGINPDGTVAFYERGFDVTGAKTIIEWFTAEPADPTEEPPVVEEEPAPAEPAVTDEQATTDEQTTTGDQPEQETTPPDGDE